MTSESTSRTLEHDKYPLHSAVLRSDEAQILTLLLQGADPNTLDNMGMAPLHWAVYRGDYETVKILLQNGANPDLRNRAGDTALWHAEDDFGLIEIARLLRLFGAVLK